MKKSLWSLYCLVKSLFYSCLERGFISALTQKYGLSFAEGVTLEATVGAFG